jgi:hypothetical protein
MPAKTWHILVAFVWLLAAPAAAYAQASMTGVVRDTSGAVLPGVTVEAASPALIEKVRTVVSDGSGQYRIENLRPGAYTVTFTLPGFATIKREGIELTGTFVATVNAELRVGAVEETITVTGETPVVDVQSTVRERVLDQEVLDVLPVNRTPGFVATLMPGVTRTGVQQDVGGISGEGSGQGTVTFRGVGGDMRVVTSGVPNHLGIGTVWAALNLQAYQEVAVDSGGVGAEQKEGGLRINLIPREGGNTFSGSFFGSFANDSMQGSNLTQDLKDRGLGTPNSIKQLTDVNPAFGGPIKRDKAWFHITARHSRAWNYVPIFFNKNAGNPNVWTYEPDTSRSPASNENTIQDVDGRFTWQATAKNKIAVALDRSKICDCPRSLSATIAPEANMGNWLSLPESQFWVEWTVPFTNRLLLQATYYRHHADFKRADENMTFAPGPVQLIGVLEQSNGLQYRGSPNVNDLFATGHFARASVAYVTGAHALKVGFLGERGTGDRVVRSTDAPIQYRFNNGVPNQITLFARPHEALTKLDGDHGLFVEDRWTVHQLTLTGGLRYDYYKLTFPEQRVGPTQFTPNRNIVLPSTDGPKWHDLSPRIGLAFDLFGDGKTAVRASAGKYLNGEGLDGTLFSNMAPSNLLVTDTPRSWNDANRNFVPDCDLLNRATNGECGAILNANFGSVVPGLVYDSDVLNGWSKRRNNWQFTAGVQREILPRVSLGVDLWRTWLGNFIATQNRAYQLTDFDRFSITAPLDPRLPGGGGYVIGGLFDVKPAAFGRAYDGFVTSADRFGKQIDRFTGVDFTFNVRPRTGLLVQGGTNTQRETTDNCDVVTQAAMEPPPRGSGVPTYNPSQLYCHVQGAFLTQLKFVASYKVPRIDVQISGSLQNLPGPEIAANYVASNAVVAPSLGRNLSGGASNVTVNLIEPRTVYGERLNQLDLRIGKIFQFGRARATASVDLYNALNSSAVLAQSNAFATWQRPQGILNARFAKVGVQFNF